jgi:hypothetical protein
MPAGFCPKERTMKNETTLPTNVAAALRCVLDYLLEDEAAHYLATSPGEDRQNHIYVSLRLLEEWLRLSEPPSD